MKIHLLFLLFLSFHNIHPNILREKPKTISTQEVDELAKDWSTVFTWTLPFKTQFVCAYAKQKTGFALRWLSIPWYIKNYKTLKNAQIEASKRVNRKKYYFDKPLQHENAIPKNIDADTCIQLIQNKNFIFYTGAGISAGSVPSMHTLMQSLRMHEGTAQFLKTTLMNSGHITKSFSNFCASCAYGTPTPAHHALKEISEHHSIAILTENVDLLHQRSGIVPFMTALAELDSLTSEEMQEIDFIVCVGLSHDDRGLLAHFKSNNPQIKFIALDLNQPNYLSNEDFLLQGDLQEILPRLKTSL